MTTPQKRGREFEVEAAEKLGLKLTPGSGNGAERSDARGQLRLSCKSSSDPVSWAEVKRHLSEAIDLAAGTGETPALALEEMDGQWIVMRLEDVAELLSSTQQTTRIARRAEVVRASSGVPLLLREEQG